MFGVIFQEHPDLRRILVDYSFKGYPLRKSFPVTGTTQVRYAEEFQRILAEALSLVQDARNTQKKTITV